LGEDSLCIYTLILIYNHKENLVQAFCNFFLKCILKLNAYLWKKWMPTSNHYCLGYEGSKSGQRNASIRTSIRTLAPPSICIWICQGKMVQGFSILIFGGHFHLQYLLKSGLKKASIYTFVYILALAPICICVRQGKKVSGFLYCFSRKHCLL
jgi:hypothetical protein